MALEGIGFGLAVLSEVRTNAKSLKERYDCYKQGPELFQKVENALTRVSDSFADISSILKDNPETLPAQTRGLFLKNQNSINGALIRVRETFERLQALDFAGTGNGGAGQRAKRKSKRAALAKSLDIEMKNAEKEASHIEAMLQHHLTGLISTLKIDEVQGSIAKTEESYRAGSKVPPLSDNLHLDFETLDELESLSPPKVT